MIIRGHSPVSARYLVLQEDVDNALQWFAIAEVPVGERIVFYKDGTTYQNIMQPNWSPELMMTWNLWFESVGGIAAFVDE